jgi:hypothetical protein
VRQVALGSSPVQPRGEWKAFGDWVVNALREIERSSYVPDDLSAIEVISTLATTSGTTHSVTGIPSAYRRLYLELDGVSFTGIATLALAVSADNGATYGTARNVSDPTTGGGDAISGTIYIDNLQTESLGCIAHPATFIGGDETTRFATVRALAGPASLIGPYNAIQISGGTFDAGAIRVFGLK